MKPLAGTNFKYNDAIEHKNESGKHPCSCGDNYCHCGTIENARVTRVDVQKLAVDLTQETALTETDRYCIERIFTIMGLWNPNNWNVGVNQGYYGEELGDITVDHVVAEKIDTEISANLRQKSVKAQIESVLILEYGYLLDDLAGCMYSAKTIDKSQIVYQKGHYTKLNREIVDQYKPVIAIPRGVVIKEDATHYRLIDGYHRVAAVEGGPIRVFVATTR